MQKIRYILDMQTLKQHTRHASFETDLYSTKNKVLQSKTSVIILITQTWQEIGINYLVVLISIQVHEFTHSRTLIEPYDHKHIRVSHKSH